ncbi:MAG: ATP phosphoribosyltransferase [Patescibacteria group bacterium]
MEKLNGNNLKIAIQQKGRLAEKSLELLSLAGLEFETYKRRLYSRCRNFPLDILYVRDDNIPEYVADGTVDLGIVGEDVIFEQQSKVKNLEKLNFGYCSLFIACPDNLDIKNISDLNNLKIASTYPNCLGDFLEKNKIKAKTIELAGSVEIAPSLNVADCICDIVSTGNTLKNNGLNPIFKIFESQAVLIADKNSLNNKSKKKNIDRLLMRIKSVIKAKKTKYIMLNAPAKSIEEIIKIIPGIDSPTIIPLNKGDLVAMHSVVEEEIFWEVIEKLKKAGATGILVSPIEKMII